MTVSTAKVARKHAGLAAHVFRTIAIGAASSLVCIAVRLVFRGLQWVFTQHNGMLPDAAASLTPWRRALTPVLGALCAMAVAWWVRRRGRRPHIREYIDAVRFHNGRIPFASTWWRTVGGSFTIGSGAAVGREGLMIQFAATVCSWMGARAPLRNVSLARQVAYGTAAAVATAYQAPVAAIFFVTEIVLGEMVWADLPFLALASGTGYVVSRTIYGTGAIFPAQTTMPVWSREWLYVLPLALVVGAAGPVYQKLLGGLQFVSKWPVALLWGGVAVGLCSVVRPEVWGNADKALIEVLHQPMAMESLGVLLVMRMLATSFCVGAGTPGGVFTPTILAGAAAGLACGHYIHAEQPVFFAILAMGCMLAATTHAPLMATFMTVELTGRWPLLPVVFVCNLVAWRVARRISMKSLYSIASPEPMHEIEH